MSIVWSTKRALSSRAERGWSSPRGGARLLGLSNSLPSSSKFPSFSLLSRFRFSLGSLTFMGTCSVFSPLITSSSMSESSTTSVGDPTRSTCIFDIAFSAMVRRGRTLMRKSDQRATERMHSTTTSSPKLQPAQEVAEVAGGDQLAVSTPKSPHAQRHKSPTRRAAGGRRRTRTGRPLPISPRSTGLPQGCRGQRGSGRPLRMNKAKSPSPRDRGARPQGGLERNLSFT